MSRIHSLQDIHHIVNQASEAIRKEKRQDGLNKAKPWDSDWLRSLRAARRAARAHVGKTALSPQISKGTRGALRPRQ